MQSQIRSGVIRKWTVLACLCILGLGGTAGAADLGGALNRAAQQVKGATNDLVATVEAAIPSGAVTYLKQVDQALDKMDRMMGPETATYTKDDRVKSATAALAEAKEKMTLIESRYGSKMGKDHSELTARRERIAAGEKAVTAFAGAMSEASQKEEADRAARDQAETDQYAAQQAKKAEEAAQRQTESAADPATAASPGKIVFSKSPIDAANPKNLTSSFKTGDMIYGLIQVPKSWRETYEAGDKEELGLMIVMETGKDKNTSQYITLKKAAYLDSKQLPIEIAPDPAKMTSYKDPAIAFGEGKGNLKIGPIAFTHELAQLAPGKHTVQVFIRNYGEKPAAGEFTIEGDDYSFYAKLHEKLKAASEALETLPPAGMVNKALEAEMRKLLENAGWTSILRVVIIDKDWWLDGQTRRYLNVAAAAKDDAGKCYWKNLQFSQNKLINGSWSPLELTKTGIQRSITEENVNK